MLGKREIRFLDASSGGSRTQSSKHQHPSSRETPRTKLQNTRGPALDLKFGASLVIGAWMLVLFARRIPPVSSRNQISSLLCWRSLPNLAPDYEPVANPAR